MSRSASYEVEGMADTTGPSDGRFGYMKISPRLATVVFFFIVPFPVTIVIPGFMTGWQFNTPFLDVPTTRWIGAVMVLFGLLLLCESIIRFAKVGRGTPSPLMPTATLVVTGAYRCVRNPMYLGATSVIIGQAYLFGRTTVLLYGAMIALAFHGFVLLYEEPTLRKRYGAEYARYCQHVPRWIPRVIPWHPT